MQFPWNDLGRGPAADVPEISVFGPGYGECILIHTGDGRWLIVDSCVEPDSESVVPLEYLARVGVKSESAVDLVVASHWHDDHVQGLSDVVIGCKRARIVCADVLTKKEFYKFVKRYAARNLADGGPGTDEFNRIHQVLASSRRSFTRAKADRRLLVIQDAALGIRCDVWSLSPSDEEFDRFLEMLADNQPKEQEPKRRAAAQKPNDASVVIALDWGPVSALLGSDLESFGASQTRGWGAVVTSQAKPATKAGYLKVPHHGGASAHHAGMWSQMLQSQPMSVLTPFWLAGTHLPSSTDVNRILTHSENAYITAHPHGKPLSAADRAVTKTLAEANVKITKQPGLGLVRCRFIDGTWRHELFNEARHLSSAR